MQRLLAKPYLLVPLCVIFALNQAEGGKPRPPPVEPLEEPPIDEEGPTVADPLDTIFGKVLPVEVGPLPIGLANLSAQGCNACHYEAYDEWAGSSHARGWQSTAFVEAVEKAGTPACMQCHLPLAAQRQDRVAFAEEDIHRPITSPNDGYDPTLHGEGVTCSACHVREGKVIGSKVKTNAPHESSWSPQLRRSQFCATCHQLTWPGADQPYYDTVGEWQRSEYANAGIQCQDCHMRPSAGVIRPGSDHSFAIDTARAVSLLIDMDRVDLVRGGDPLKVTLTLQNTGSGHSFPTGNPFRGIRLEAALAGIDSKGLPIVESSFVVDLVRTLEDEPPWLTTTDTRLLAGDQRSWSADLALSPNAPSDRWDLRVSLHETMSGEPAGEPILLRRIPLRVD